MSSQTIKERLPVTGINTTGAASWLSLNWKNFSAKRNSSFWEARAWRCSHLLRFTFGETIILKQKKKSAQRKNVVEVETDHRDEGKVIDLGSRAQEKSCG